MSNLKALQQQLPQDLDAALIESGVNRYYFTGFPSTAGVLLILRDAAYFLIDFRYYHKAKAQVKDCTVIEMKRFVPQLQELFSRHHVMMVGVESESMTLSEYRRYQEQFPDVYFDKGEELQSLITELRQVKSPQELAKIRAAQAVTDAAFTHILNTIHIGMTELEVAWELESYMRTHGADGLAFDTIAASGENSASPHATPTERPLQSGDFLTMDFGARVDGYCSDMTRTVAIGTPTEKMCQMYDLTLQAQNASFSVLKAGAVCKDVDAAARETYAAAGLAEHFGHGLGHSVGLEIHESPACNTRDETKLKAGMLMTVEPGLYLPNEFGVRIEDLTVVTEDGYENLTHSPKELIIL